MLIWHYSSLGEFNVKIAHHMGLAYMDREVYGDGDEGTSTSAVESCWKLIWKLNIPSKVKCVVWRMCHYILPTKDNLNKRDIGVWPDCVQCGSGA